MPVIRTPSSEGDASCEYAASLSWRYIYNLQVAPKDRRRGLATQLVEMCSATGSRRKPVYAASEPTPEAQGFWSRVAHPVEKHEVPKGLQLLMKSYGHSELRVFVYDK